ncbi:MAG TPA: histidine kinase [Pyrinomonadaceae bacterium]|jgi:anti-sigma regulatory factor (Ser/Thr protein kinase)
MEEIGRAPRSRTKWWLIFGCWSLVALFFSSQAYVQARIYQLPVTFLRVMSWQFSSCYVWFLLTPIILWLNRRFPLERGKWRRSLPAHILFSILVALVQQSVDARVLPLLGYYPGVTFKSYWEAYKFFLFVNFHLALFFYWAILGVNYAIDYYQKYRERELRASQLEMRLAQARLQVLKMQLHPHFLFNTLNAISELVYKDPESAEQMITNLSDLLRLSLENVGVQEVPLKQELDFLNKYVEIEQTRFHDRLRLSMEIEPETLDACVPNMILQPLVENAIRHGIGMRSSGGQIEIGADREGGMLHLFVRDDGRGLLNGEQKALKEGVGLANTRARLAHLYGASHRFDLKNSPGGGLTVDLAIPFRNSLLSDDEDSDHNR